MSFMAGFGSSFSNSFNASVARSENQKNDMLRMGYADFIDRSKERREKEAKAAQEVKSAKVFAETLGLPKEAFSNVIQWRDAGFSHDQIAQMTRNAVWGSPKTDSAQSIADPRQNVSNQMSQSGLAPAAEKTMGGQANQEQQKMAPNSRPGLLGSLSGIFEKKSPEEKQKANNDRNIQQIAKHTGQNPEVVKAVMESTPSQAELERNGSGLQVSGIDTSVFMGKDSNGVDLTSEGKAIDALVSAQAEYQANPTPENKAKVDRAQNVLNIHAERSTETLRNKSLFEAQAQGGGQNQHLVTVELPDGKTKQIETYDAPQIGEEYQGGKVTKQRVIPLQERERIDKFRDQTQAERIKINQKATAAENAVAATGELIDLVRSDKTVLAGKVGQGTQFIASLQNELNAGMELINEVMGSDLPQEQINERMRRGMYDAQMRTNSIEDYIKDQGAVMSPIQRAAANRALFESKRNLLAYQIGSMMSQEGRSLSEPERKTFTDMAARGRDPESFIKNASGVIMMLKDQVQAEVDNYYNGVVGDSGFEYLPDNMKSFSIDERIANSKNPKARSGFEEMSKYRRMAPSELYGDKSEKKEAPAKNQPVVDKPQTIRTKDEYDKLPKGTIYFDVNGKKRKKG